VNHLGVRAEVLRRIRARDWVPGVTIPSEEALAVEFGCARATVNRALRDLAVQGVLERRRKAGTRVALLPVRKAVVDIPVIRLDVEARGQVYGHRLLERSMGVPPVPVASRAGFTGRMLYLETLHLADGRPYAFEARWLNVGVLPGLPDFAEVSANEWLVSNVRYTTGDIAFSAEAASLREGAVLGVAAGTPLFVTDRATWVEDQVITVVRLCHAPGYRLQAGV
jgi:GntR family transcriptional regulator, histidine utilization repressor